MDSSSQCTICLEELSKDLVAAPCGHVFHSLCIEKWKSVQRSCPMCKAPMPAALLRLFYARDESSLSRGIGASTKCNGSVVHGDLDTLQASDDKTGATSADSEDVARLRAEVAANNKVLQVSGELIETYKNKIKSLTDEIYATKLDSTASKLALEAQLEEADGKLKETKIELSKKHKEWFKLKREVDTKQKQLDVLKSERRTNEYIAQFAAQKSRVMNGLGQVSVEPIVEDVAKGVTRAEDVIRGQHELLSRNMDQQQRTLLILRKSKEECTEAVEELRAVRAECNFARKNAVRCQRALAREKSRRKDARVCWPSTESSPTGNDVLQRGRQGPGALSLPSGDDEGCISLDEDEDEDSLDDERGGRTGEACSSSASGKRKRKLERQDGPSGDADEKASDASKEDLNLASQKRRTCASRESPAGVGLTRLEKALGMSVVGPAFTSIRGSSAGSGASAGAGAGAAVSMAKGSTRSLASSRGKYICNGYDAMGGRHSVRTPVSGGVSDALRRKKA